MAQCVTLSETLRNRGIRVKDVCQSTGLGKSVVYKAMNGRKVSTTTLAKLANFLGMEIPKMEKLIDRSCKGG